MEIGLNKTRVTNLLTYYDLKEYQFKIDTLFFLNKLEWKLTLAK